MTDKTCYWDDATKTTLERDCTLEEQAEIDALRANAPMMSKLTRMAEIKAQLSTLDVRRIRPIAEGDTAYLATLNTQVTTLRAELYQLKQDTASFVPN